MATVTVEAYGAPNSSGLLDFNFEDWMTLALTSSMAAPAEASFELGDDTGWERMAELVGLGAQFRVYVDDRLRMTGRVEQLTSTLDARQSVTQRFCLRTKMSDAVFSSAPQGVRLHGQSIKAFLLQLYAEIGLGEADFDFRGDVSRDIMTGRSSRGGKPLRELDPLKEEDAKVQPPESIFDAADRLLRRHGYLHWDGPDGRIVVAAPDDQQEPIATLRLFRGNAASDGQYNNVLSAERGHDVSQAPTHLGVFGMSRKAAQAGAKVSTVLINADLFNRGFRRKTVIIDEAMNTKSLAERRAAREFATRKRGLDSLTVTVDGLSYSDGSDPIPWAPDTTVDVIVEPLGGALGIYYVEEVQMSRNSGDGDATRLLLVKQGVWQL